MRCGFAIVAVLLTACGSSVADTGSPSTSTTSTTSAGCGPVRAHTLAIGSQARVYASAGFVYGCSATTRRTTRLGRSNRCIAASRAGPAAVAGELAAYGLESCGVDTGSGEVVVRRLSDGRGLRTLDATQGPRRPESYQSVSSIVVRRDGAVAWIARASSLGGGGQSSLQVLAADAGSGARLLDSGAGIAPASLALHGSRLTWKDGGQSRSASLR